MAGLVPAIYAVPRISSCRTSARCRKPLNLDLCRGEGWRPPGFLRGHGVDGRDKPGHDVWVTACPDCKSTSGAKFSSEAREPSVARPLRQLV
jgi:hypothetical protein